MLTITHQKNLCLIPNHRWHKLRIILYIRFKLRNRRFLRRWREGEGWRGGPYFVLLPTRSELQIKIMKTRSFSHQAQYWKLATALFENGNERIHNWKKIYKTAPGARMCYYYQKRTFCCLLTMSKVVQMSVSDGEQLILKNNRRQFAGHAKIQPNWNSLPPPVNEQLACSPYMRNIWK